MPRRKVSMGLIPNSRVRATTFSKRKEGLKKKARELATLCGVRVAVVTAADGAGGGADVWESAEGVLDAYRARHTHRAYAELEARKAEAKLVKVQQEGPPALAQWDAAVYALTLDEARRMLAAVDAAARAVNERRAALGLPVDADDDGFDGGGGGSWIRGFAAPPGASVDAIVPFGLAAAHPFVGSFDGGYLQLRAQGGSNANDNDHVVWDNNNGFDPRGAGMVQQPGYAFQQCGVDVDAYKLQMATDVYDYGNSSNSAGRLAWDAFQPPATNELAAMQPVGYGFQCTGSNSSYVGMSSGYLGQQIPGTTNNSIVPMVGYPSLETGYKLMDAPAAHAAAAAAQGVGGGMSLAGSGFTAALPALSLTMGTGDSYVNAAQPLAMSFNDDLMNASDYAAQWSAGHLQSDGSSQQSSNKSLWEAL